MSSTNKTTRQSIFIYSFKTILIILAFNFVIMFFMSRIVFNNFYFATQNKIFASVYEEIENIKEVDVSSAEFRNIIDICRHNNCTIEVYDSSTNRRLYSPYMYESEVFASVNSKEIFDEIIGGTDRDGVVINGMGNDIEAQNAINNLNGLNNAYSLLIRKTDNIYILVQTTTETKNLYQTMLSKVMLWCLMVSACVGLIPAYFVSKSMLVNITTVKNAAKRFTEQDFSEKCVTSKFSEFFELSEYINEMANSLSRQMNEIEEQNKQLEIDLERKKILEQSQKEFVSNVSHELKTPISIISGYAEGVKYGLVKTEEDKEKYCNTIINECERMRNIVKQLLDLSYLENITLDICENNISSLCKIVIDKFKTRYVDRAFYYNEQDCVFAYFDYDEIEKVIVNYIENAVKYSTGIISINLSQDNDYVYVNVCSNGHIDDADVNKIWDRFYRADKSHKRSENSTGLGLSIVKATMEKHKMLYGVLQQEDGIVFYIGLKKVI